MSRHTSCISIASLTSMLYLLHTLVDVKNIVHVSLCVNLVHVFRILHNLVVYDTTLSPFKSLPSCSTSCIAVGLWTSKTPLKFIEFLLSRLGHVDGFNYRFKQIFIVEIQPQQFVNKDSSTEFLQIETFQQSLIHQRLFNY